MPRGLTVLLTVLLLASSPATHADAAALSVAVTCQKLLPAQRDELEARVRLLVGASDAAPARIELGCDAARAWVDWSGEVLPVIMQEPFADQFLDAIEARIERGPPAPPDPNADEPWPGETVPDDDDESRGAAPSSARTSAASPSRAERWTASQPFSGGMALGIAFEPPAASVDPVAGPFLEFGIPLTKPLVFGSPLLVSIVESGRFGSAGPYSVMLLDFGAGLSLGAPLAPGARFGVATRFEAEWMIAYPDGTSARAAFAPTMMVGLRAAHDVGFAGLWTELAGRARLSELELRGASTVAASTFGAQFTLGVAFLDQRPE